MVYIKNQAGLSAPLAFVPIVFPEALERLARHVQSGSASPELRELVDILHLLPLRRSCCPSISDFPGPNNSTLPVSKYGSHAAQSVRVILLPDKFKSNSPPSHDLDQVLSPTPGGLGWLAAPAIARLAAKVESEVRALGVDIPPANAQKAARALKKSAEWTIVNPGPADLLQAQACVVYLARQNGFVNDKHDPVPLAGARLFESRAAADRTIRSHGWLDAVVVEVAVKLQGLAPPASPDETPPTNLGMLAAALAMRQAEDLDHGTAQSLPTTRSTPAARF